MKSMHYRILAVTSLVLVSCEGSDQGMSASKTGAVFTQAPTVPSVLSSNPDDPDWVFEGYAKALSKEETDRRRSYNDYIRTLSEEDYLIYKAKIKAERKATQRAEAERKGKTFDSRDDLYVALLPNNQVWRKKKSVDRIAKGNHGTPSSGTTINAGVAPAAQLMWDEKEENSIQWDTNGPGIRVNPRTKNGHCVFSDCSASTQNDAEDSVRNVTPAGSGNLTGARTGARFAVFGSDTRSLISNYNGNSLTSYPWRTQGMLTNSSQSDDDLPIDLNCSGTKIAARVVVTAGHCLYEGGWTSNADRWYPGPDGIDALMNGGDPTPNGYKGWVTHLVHPDWYDDGDYKDDMGWHILADNQNSCNLGWLGYADESGLDGDTVNIYGVPGEYQSCTASPQSNDYCYASVYGTSGTVTTARVSSIQYAIDTSPGQSGTGVYKYYSSSGNRYVVAVHSGQWDSNENYGCRMNDNKFDMTSGVVDDYPSSYCD